MAASLPGALTAAAVSILCISYGHAPAPVSSAPAAVTAPASSGARLFQRDSDLAIVGGAHLGSRKGGFFYVLEADPSVPGSRTRRALGVVRGVEGLDDTLWVRWTCRLPSGRAIPPTGFPVEELHPNSLLYRGPCWGRSLPAREPMPPGPTLDLVLDRGSSDDVKVHDRYEVLSVDAPDPSREVGWQNFRRLGICRIVLENLQEYRAHCRIERALAPDFDQAAWMNGVFVHQLEPQGTQP